MKPELIADLLAQAERMKPKPPPVNLKDVALELYEVVGELWEKGLTRKATMAWFKKRGFAFKEYHLATALKRYWEERDKPPQQANEQH